MILKSSSRSIEIVVQSSILTNQSIACKILYNKLDNKLVHVVIGGFEATTIIGKECLCGMLPDATAFPVVNCNLIFNMLIGGKNILSEITIYTNGAFKIHQVDGSGFNTGENQKIIMPSVNFLLPICI